MTPRVAPNLTVPGEAIGKPGHWLRTPATTSEELRGSSARNFSPATARVMTNTAQVRRPGSAASFWRWMTAPALFNEPEEFLEQTELRVLSKAASGGGFCVPDDVANMVISAGRSVSPIAQLAQEFVTQRGEVLGVPIAGTHGVASWVAESGAITPSDETITR
jgi:HK97 family phage major capsid protein